MPSGKGKTTITLYVDEDEKAYLQVEAQSRRISLNALALSGIELLLHPDRYERTSLQDQLLSVANTLATLQPKLQALERTATRTEALGRELDTLRAEVKTSLVNVEKSVKTSLDTMRGEVNRLSAVRQSQAIRRYAIGGLTIAFGLTWIWLYWPAFSLGGMVALLGAAIILIP